MDENKELTPLERANGLLEVLNLAYRDLWGEKIAKAISDDDYISSQKAHFDNLKIGAIELRAYLFEFCKNNNLELNKNTLKKSDSNGKQQ